MLNQLPPNSMLLQDLPTGVMRLHEPADHIQNLIPIPLQKVLPETTAQDQDTANRKHTAACLRNSRARVKNM